MKIEVLGTGCPKCNQLYANAEEAAQALGLDYEMVKVKDLNEIMAYGVMMTPALSIDGTIKSTGKALSVDEIKSMLSSL